MYDFIIKIVISVIILLFFVFFYKKYLILQKRNDMRIEELEKRITELLLQYDNSKLNDSDVNSVFLDLLDKCYQEQREINKDSKDLFKWWYAEILATFTLLFTVLVVK